MNNAEVVRSLLTAIERRDQSAARALMTADFVFDGAVPQPINADAWLGIHGALSDAMSDFRFNPANFAAQGDAVTGTVQLTGTHDGTLALPIPGFSPLKASGAAVALPAEQVSVTVVNGKVARYHVKPSPNGGLPSIVKQMGGSL